MQAHRNDRGQFASTVACPKGHLRTPENTYVKPNGKRECRLCAASRTRRFQARTPERQSWRAMKERCLRPGHGSWAYYGGRGILVCERWLTFENFFADMGERPEGTTLDRVDPDGNYEPRNCRWATYAEQTANRKARS